MGKVERLNEAFQYLRSTGKIHTQIDLAQVMKANRVTISNALKDKGGYLNDDFLLRFCNAFEGIFNEKWLLTGEGEMLINGNTNKNNQSNMKTESNNPDGYYTTYLLPLSAMGGSLTGFAADGVMLQNCEAIVSPIANVDFAITVYGDSMAPEYPSGSRILINKINPDIFIEWGKTFVLDTPNGVIVKEIWESNQEGYITCHSINPAPKYKDFDVPMDEIYGMYRVLMCLSAK